MPSKRINYFTWVQKVLSQARLECCFGGREAFFVGAQLKGCVPLGARKIKFGALQKAYFRAFRTFRAFSDITIFDSYPAKKRSQGSPEPLFAML